MRRQVATGPYDEPRGEALMVAQGLGAALG